MRSIRSFPVAVPAFLAAVALITTMPAAAAAEPTAGCTDKPDIRDWQPIDGGTLKVARIAGSDSSEADEWDMAYDTWWCNPTTSEYTVTAAKIRHRDGNTVIRTRNPVPGGDPVIDPNGNDPGFLLLRETGESGQFPFPLPDTARITLTLTETGAGNGPASVTVIDTLPLALHRNPRGGYFPPFRQSDLPDDQFWSQQRHGDSNFQRWAYDLGVERWTGEGWSYLEAGGDSDVSADFNIYGEPVYAMSDGEIIGCNRGAPDNADPDNTVGNEPGGNMLWVRFGNETTLYAHLANNSIPFALCPFSDDDQHKLADPNQNLASDAPYRIKAGQFLGTVGTSGFSRGDPHLHVHTFMGLPAIWGGSETGRDADSRPLMFFNTQVQPRSSENVDDDIWNTHDPAAQLPYGTYAKGDACGELERAQSEGTGERVRLQTSPACFGDVYNTLTYRGLRLTHIDVAETSGGSTAWTTVWRPAGGVGWAFYYGISEAKAQSVWDDSDLVLLEAESYRRGSNLRFAMLFVDEPQSPGQRVELAETAAQFGQSFADNKGDGFWPATMSVTELNDIAYISTVYDKASVGSWFINAGLPLSGYQEAFDDNAEAGRGMSWVESHVEDGVVRLAVIWYSKLTGPYAASDIRTKSQMEADIPGHIAAGGFTRSLTGFQPTGPFNFLGLWRAAPESTIKTGPSRVTNSHTASFTFKSSDPFATRRCRLDSRPWTACKGSASYARLANGPHTFRVRSRSRERIVEPAAAIWSWSIGGRSRS